MAADTPKRKKVDHEALNAQLMRIPKMEVAVVRDLLDIGVRYIDELRGRAPEALADEIRARKGALPEDRIRFLRMAVYYAESAEPDRDKMRPEAWI